MKKVLIQLIGGQPLPNIFSLLSVVPDEVVNIYTQETQEQHEDIKAWCAKFGKDFGLTPKFRECAPVSREFRRLQEDLRDILAREAQCGVDEGNTLLILNMTGGTKPMATWAMNICIGLEQQFRALGKVFPIPIFYVDTQARSFDFFIHRDMQEQVLLHAPFTRRLSLQQIAEAKKYTRLISGRTDWKIAYPAARLLREQFSDINLIDIDRNNVTEDARKPLCAFARDKDDCLKIRRLADLVGKDPVLQASLRSSGVEWQEGELRFSAALRRRAEELCRRDPMNKKEKVRLLRLLSDLQSAHNFLVGGWWEVLVAYAYQTIHPDAEVLWSVETKSGSAFVETDVIASDGWSLTCISCKRRKHTKVTQELEQHCTRTELLGGVLNRRIISVFEPEDEDLVSRLASALHMEVWGSKKVDAVVNNTKFPEDNKEPGAEVAAKGTVSRSGSSASACPTGGCQKSVLNLIEKDIDRKVLPQKNKKSKQDNPSSAIAQNPPAPRALSHQDKSDAPPASKEISSNIPEHATLSVYARSLLSILRRVWGALIEKF